MITTIEQNKFTGLESRTLEQLTEEAKLSPTLPKKDEVVSMDGPSVQNARARITAERSKISQIADEVQNRYKKAEADGKPEAELTALLDFQNSLSSIRRELLSLTTHLEQRAAQIIGGDPALIEAEKQKKAAEKQAKVDGKKGEILDEINKEKTAKKKIDTMAGMIAALVIEVEELKKTKTEPNVDDIFADLPEKQGKTRNRFFGLFNRLSPQAKKFAHLDNGTEDQLPKIEKPSLELKYIGYMPNKLNDLVQSLYINAENGKAPNVVELNQFLTDLDAKGEVTNPHIQELVAALATVLRDANIYKDPSFEDASMKARMQMTDAQMGTVKTSAEKAVSLMGSFDNENKKKFRKLAIPLTQVLQPKPAQTTNP
jgi:hypothetical protein